MSARLLRIVKTNVVTVLIATLVAVSSGSASAAAGSTFLPRVLPQLSATVNANFAHGALVTVSNINTANATLTVTLTCSGTHVSSECVGREISSVDYDNSNLYFAAGTDKTTFFSVSLPSPVQTSYTFMIKGLATNQAYSMTVAQTGATAWLGVCEKADSLEYGTKTDARFRCPAFSRREEK